MNFDDYYKEKYGIVKIYAKVRRSYTYTTEKEVWDACTQANIKELEELHTQKKAAIEADDPLIRKLREVAQCSGIRQAIDWLKENSNKM